MIFFIAYICDRHYGILPLHLLSSECQKYIKRHLLEKQQPKFDIASCLDVALNASLVLTFDVLNFINFTYKNKIFG